MKGASRINKQIRKNIGRLTEDKYDKSAIFTNLIVRVMMIVIAITIPFASLSIAANIIFKNQDIYSFEFERSGMISKVSGDMSPEDMASQMVDFLSGKEDTIKSQTPYGETYNDIFIEGDIENLTKFRMFLDRILVFAIVFLIISIILFAMLFVSDRTKELRKAFNIGGVVYIVLVVFSVMLALIEPFREMILKNFLGVVYASNSLLPIIFTGFYRAMAATLIAIVAFIIFAILYTIGSKFFKEHKMFE